MLHYTDALTRLMADIVARVPDLGHVPMTRMLVFARRGRHGACGPNATCHWIGQPPSEPGYYFWSEPDSGRITRRTPYFVTRWPEVHVRGEAMEWLISVGLPRFADQPAAAKRRRYYDLPAWVCRLDTIVHELFHIAPDGPGFRALTLPDGSPDGRTHPPAFFDAVELLVREYLGTDPDPDVLEVVRHDLDTLIARHGGLAATTFRRYPSYPQRYAEALAVQPPDPDVLLTPLPRTATQASYTDADVVTRDVTALVTTRTRHAA